MYSGRVQLGRSSEESQKGLEGRWERLCSAVGGDWGLGGASQLGVGSHKLNNDADVWRVLPGESVTDVTGK